MQTWPRAVHIGKAEQRLLSPHDFSPWGVAVSVRSGLKGRGSSCVESGETLRHRFSPMCAWRFTGHKALRAGVLTKDQQGSPRSPQDAGRVPQDVPLGSAIASSCDVLTVALVIAIFPCGPSYNKSQGP